MDEQDGEKPDGSSIKPVSSLRSHFEQMTSSTSLKPSPTTSRPVSPKPRIQVHGFNSSKNVPADFPSPGLIRPNESPDMSLLATGKVRQRPVSIGPVLSFPAVTIEPPSSPPKNGTFNYSVPSMSNHLAADSSRSSTPSAPPSPRYLQGPSRPQTPVVEPRKSTSASSQQPPEPPPPRRSGELRRDISGKVNMGPPPPVNRAEKPRVAIRQPLQSPSLFSGASISAPDDRVSPFNSPPTSSENTPSPEQEGLPPPISKPRPVTMDYQARAQAFELKFDPPPTQRSVANRRGDQESFGLGHSAFSSADAGHSSDVRPPLPMRHAGMPPVSSRASIDSQRPVTHLAPSMEQPRATRTVIPSSQIGSTYATPPKRIVSTPTTQVATPPRHGRSMTVDQTSDKAPPSFRTPIRAPISVASHADNSTQRGPTAPAINPPSSMTEYPDSSLSNRRPPRHKQGASEIRCEGRVFDVCGKYACAAGILTRVWNLRDGEQIFSTAHGEGVRILSIAFKPASTVEAEGSRIWLGNNFGELIEIDVISQSMVGNKTNAHARHEVIKIYRHINELWTLDDVGTLHVWGPDDSGVPSLGNVPQSYRVPKGHSFSMVVDDELWHATGSELRVFVPTYNGNVQFQVLQRPLSQAGTGDITSGTVLNSQPDRVYIGHNDGKVSIYARTNYTCLGVVNVNMYKINTLSGAGDFLWAGYNTGMIYVYDTTKSPWEVKKEWRAHDNPVMSLIKDRASFWELDRSQILSLGADSFLRVWDGMLEEDWLEGEMQANDSTFCQFEKIKTLVMTWNAGASTPNSLRYTDKDSLFMRNLLQSSDSPDIIVFGFQELVDLENKKTTAKSFFKSKKKDSTEPEHMSHQYRDWRDYLIRSLDEALPNDEVFHLLHSASLVGLFTCVFVKSRLRDRIRGLCGVEVKRGMGGLHGNKGALIVRFMLADTSVCFVNCHLAAGQTQTKERNYDVSEILESTLLPVERDPKIRLDCYGAGGDGSMILDHEICIWNGDLNYRIDTMPRDAVVNAVKNGNISKLLERDQLLLARRKNPAFRLRAFQELPIEFDPTYKYDVGTDRYDTSEKRRAPAWCDRILFRSRNQARIMQLDYRRHEVMVSDHRPVTGLFHMTIKTISQKQRAVAWEDARRRLEVIKSAWAADSITDYLTHVCGFSLEDTLAIIKASATR